MVLDIDSKVRHNLYFVKFKYCISVTDGSFYGNDLLIIKAIKALQIASGNAYISCFETSLIGSNVSFPKTEACLGTKN